jgi:hypothetical protein
VKAELPAARLAAGSSPLTLPVVWGDESERRLSGATVIADRGYDLKAIVIDEEVPARRLLARIRRQPAILPALHALRPHCS